MTAPDPDPDKIRARQRSRAIMLGIALAAFVNLLYAITIAKMSINQ